MFKFGAEIVGKIPSPSDSPLDAIAKTLAAGELANGARGYEAGVEIYRDGARVGSGRWDGEGFDGCVDLDGRPLDLGDGEQLVWDALSEMVREHLASIPNPDAGGLALAL